MPQQLLYCKQQQDRQLQMSQQLLLLQAAAAAGLPKQAHCAPDIATTAAFIDNIGWNMLHSNPDAKVLMLVQGLALPVDGCNCSQMSKAAGSTCT